MPKEVIHPSTPDSSIFIPVVGLANDRDVQLGIKSADGEGLLGELFGDDHWMAEWGRWIRLLPDGIQQRDLTDTQIGKQALGALQGITMECADYDSLWANLDRAQINRLIRALRKARDAAYGSDA